MHTLQRIAIRAENKEDAFDSVRRNLEAYMDGSTWYDWFVTGGGRWNENTDGYDDNDQSMTISYEEEPDRFISEVNKAIENRKQEFSNYMKDIDFNGIQDKLIAYDGQMDFGFELYPLGKAIDMMNGNWDFNSYFFDNEHDSTNTMHMLKSIDKGEKNWFLVYIDFHF